MTGEGIKKKRDPIFSVCFVVFVVACVGVLGVYVDEHYLEKDETMVAVGDKVQVNYTGSYYAYYGEDGAVVFDTTYANIGNDAGVKKSNEFNKSSFSTIDVTVGDGKYLKMFENSLIGHKTGDKIRVEIPKEQAYLAPGDSAVTNASTSLSIPKVQELTEDRFEDLYEDVDLSGGVSVPVKSVYGWDALAYLDVTKNVVIVTNMPDQQRYEYVGNEDSEFGDVFYTVTGQSDNAYNVTISFENTTPVQGGIQMLEAVGANCESIYVTSVGSNTFDYKTCAERCNINLYFEIEIVSIA